MARKTPTRKISKKIEREMRKYVGELQKDKLPIASVYLFGSYAKGTEHKWSDIDVCVISPQFKDFFDTLQYLWQKRIKDSGTVIEPIGFSPKDFADDTTLTREIKRTGIKLNL